MSTSHELGLQTCTTTLDGRDLTQVLVHAMLVVEQPNCIPVLLMDLFMSFDIQNTKLSIMCFFVR